MQRGVIKILAAVLLMNSVMVQAGVYGSLGAAVSGKGVGVHRQLPVNPQDPKVQFSAYCAYILKLAKNDAKTVQWLAGNGKVSRNDNGKLSVTFRCDLLKQCIMNFIQGVSPLFISGVNIKWQMGVDEVKTLLDTLRRVTCGYGITLKRFEERQDWVRGLIDALTAKGEYFTEEGWNVWQEQTKLLKERLDLKLLECIRKITQGLQKLYINAVPTEEEVKSLVSLMKHARRWLRVLIEREVTEVLIANEVRDLMNAFFGIFLLKCYHNPSEWSTVEKRQDQIWQSGLGDQFLELMYLIHIPIWLTWDRDIAGRPIIRKSSKFLKNTLNRVPDCRVVGVQPGDFDGSENENVKSAYPDDVDLGEYRREVLIEIDAFKQQVVRDCETREILGIANADFEHFTDYSSACQKKVIIGLDISGRRIAKDCDTGEILGVEKACAENANLSDSCAFELSNWVHPGDLKDCEKFSKIPLEKKFRWDREETEGCYQIFQEPWAERMMVELPVTRHRYRQKMKEYKEI